MIYDTTDRLPRYLALCPLLEKCDAFLRRRDLDALDDGKYELDGERCFAMLQRYDTLPEAQKQYEAHRRYVDLQSVLAGRELVGVTPIESITAPMDFHVEKDVALFPGVGDFLTLRPGRFVILFPEDAHMPGVSVNGPEPVRKVVFKIEAAAFAD